MIDNTELGKYLKKLRENNNISLREMEKLTGIGYSYLSMIENGKRKVTPALLQNLAKIYNSDYIDLYEKAGYIDLLEREKMGNLINEVSKIPILSTVKSKYDLLAKENVVDYITVKEVLPNINEYYALKITGDSMLPLLSEGDLVIVHNQNDIESGQTAVILISDEEATIKKVIKTNEGIELHSMNPYYPVRKFTYEDMKKIPVRIIGRVKEAKIKGAFE